MEWKCLICKQPINIFREVDDTKCWLPNLEGGTILINFGYGSEFDDGNVDEYERIEHEACIGDSCYKRKKHLTRAVVIHKQYNKKILPKDYREVDYDR